MNWTTKDGQEIDAGELTDDHLLNIYRLIKDRVFTMRRMTDTFDADDFFYRHPFLPCAEAELARRGLL